jgi:hypothetical protein
VDSAAYVRKMITTPEQSPDVKGTSKRKSKHVVIEDILVADKTEKKKDISKDNKKSSTKENDTSATENESSNVKPTKTDDEPIFEDDDDFQEEPEPKRSKRAKK